MPIVKSLLTVVLMTYYLLHNKVLQETIYSNDAIYRFLIYYFLDDLPSLETDDRWTLSQAMAAWLPYEKHLAEILKKIEGLRATASNGKGGC